MAHTNGPNCFFEEWHIYKWESSMKISKFQSSLKNKTKTRSSGKTRPAFTHAKNHELRKNYSLIWAFRHQFVTVPTTLHYLPLVKCIYLASTQRHYKCNRNKTKQNTGVLPPQHSRDFLDHLCEPHYSLESLLCIFLTISSFCLK